jgi:hypothetical protein
MASITWPSRYVSLCLLSSKYSPTLKFKRGTPGTDRFQGAIWITNSRRTVPHSGLLAVSLERSCPNLHHDRCFYCRPLSRFRWPSRFFRCRCFDLCRGRCSGVHRNYAQCFPCREDGERHSIGNVSNYGPNLRLRDCPSPNAWNGSFHFHY